MHSRPQYSRYQLMKFPFTCAKLLTQAAVGFTCHRYTDHNKNVRAPPQKKTLSPMSTAEYLPCYTANILQILLRPLWLQCAQPPCCHYFHSCSCSDNVFSLKTGWQKLPLELSKIWQAHKMSMDLIRTPLYTAFFIVLHRCTQLFYWYHWCKENIFTVQTCKKNIRLLHVAWTGMPCT